MCEALINNAQSDAGVCGLELLAEIAQRHGGLAQVLAAQPQGVAAIAAASARKPLKASLLRGREILKLKKSLNRPFEPSHRIEP